MRLVRLFLPEERAEAFSGDVQEEFARRIDTRGRVRTTIWQAGEIASLAIHTSWKWLLLAISFGGTTGAVAFGLKAVDLEIGTYLACVFVVLVPMALFRIRPPQTYFLRFLTALTAFMTMIAVLYAAIYNLDPHVGTISLWGHAWRLGMMLAIGTVASACAALMSPGGSRSPYGVPLGLAILGFGAIYMTLIGRGGWLVLAVIGIVLLATASFLSKHNTQPFARRFLVMLGVNAVMTGLTCALHFAASSGAAVYKAWAVLFQNGLLYVEIAATSLLFAWLSTVLRYPRSATGRAPDEPDPDPIPSESARRS